MQEMSLFASMPKADLSNSEGTSPILKAIYELCAPWFAVSEKTKFEKFCLFDFDQIVTLSTMVTFHRSALKNRNLNVI